MFKTFVPSKVLQPYIAFYSIIKFRKDDYQNGIGEYCLPSGHGHMGFHSMGSFHVVQNNEKQELPRFYTMGQQTHNYHMNSDAVSVELYAATFKPTGLWHFFGLDMPAITDNSVATSALLNGSIRKFTEQFDFEQEPRSRIKLIENTLLRRFQSVQPQLNVIDSAIEVINGAFGCYSIKELTNKLGISERYFEKKFKKMVGIAPSTYTRIVRFNNMFAELNPNTPVDCKSLSNLFNYYDFPHFSKDFKKYCGVCPSKFHIDKFNFLQELMASKAWLDEPQ